MRQNIYNNSVKSIYTKLYEEKYYDFMLHRDGAMSSSNPEDMAIAEFCCPFDMAEDGKIYSTKTWQDAANSGTTLWDIGFTGIDNGFIKYDKNTITNEDFLKIFTGSTYDLKENDVRTFLTPVSGNTGRFKFPMYYTNNEDECFVSFKGGFYQGFYKMEGFDYQTLPNRIENNRILHFQIRPRSDYKIEENTINALHPKNKGIFFYMGLRAENKMFPFYETDNKTLSQFIINPEHEDMKNPKNLPYLSEELDKHKYFGDEYNTKMSCPSENEEDEKETKTDECKCGRATNRDKSIYGYYEDNTTWIKDCGGCTCPKEPEVEDCSKYFKDDYYQEDIIAQPEDVEFKVESEECPTCDNTNKDNIDEYAYNADNNCPTLGTITIKKECDCEKHAGKIYDSGIYGYYEDNTNWIKDCGGCDCSNGKCDCSETIDCSQYFGDGYLDVPPCAEGNKSIDESYMKNDIIIDEDKLKETITDSEGHNINKKGYYHIDTDNKFLIFDRTPDGVTVDTYEDGMKVRLEGRKDWGNVNLFTLMNRTPTGWTVDNIEEYYEAHKKPYDVYKDLKNNAFALRITENGAIGYRYGILDCDADDNYSVVEEYTKDNIVKRDEWNSINVRFVIIPPYTSKCDTRKRKMKIMIYVNGFLKLVSKELDTFNFHALDECAEKQEGVPYSMSLGGGTLGLLEMITPDYYKVSNYLLPLERDFCGSFLGDIRCFKIYEGFANYSSIRNYLSEK